MDRNSAKANQKASCGLAISDDFPHPGARGYQFLGANYQAEVLDSALPLRHATGTSQRLDGQRTMESFAYGILGAILTAPSIRAASAAVADWLTIAPSEAGFTSDLEPSLDKVTTEKRV